MLTFVRISAFSIPDFSIHRNTTSDRNSEVERIFNYIAQTDKDSFVEYDDITVRRLVECITVSNDGRIVVTLKGGFREEEII